MHQWRTRSLSTRATIGTDELIGGRPALDFANLVSYRGTDRRTIGSNLPATTTRSLVDELAVDAASLLTSAESLGRVAACLECRWLFLDSTRNHSRQWRDPADCGNRARQRRHYRRRR